MKLPTILAGLAGKIVKNCPLSEPTRLQDLEASLEKNKNISLSPKKWDFAYIINLKRRKLQQKNGLRMLHAAIIDLHK